MTRIRWLLALMCVCGATRAVTAQRKPLSPDALKFYNLFGTSFDVCGQAEIDMVQSVPAATLAEGWSTDGATRAASSTAALVEALTRRCEFVRPVAATHITTFEVVSGVALRKLVAARSAGWAIDEVTDIRPESSAKRWDTNAGTLYTRHERLPRGFSEARLLHEDADRALFSTPFAQPNGDMLFIVIRKGIGPSDPVMAMTVEHPFYATASLLPAETDYLERALRGKKLSEASAPQRFVVAYYHDALALPMNVAAGRDSLEAPVVAATFQYASAGPIAGAVFGGTYPSVARSRSDSATDRRPSDLRDMLRGRHSLSLHNSFVDALELFSEPFAKADPGATTGLFRFARTTPQVAMARRDSIRFEFRNRRLAEEASARASAVRGGFVYKSPKFWLQAPAAVTRNLFAGGEYSEGIRAPIVRVMIDRYVRAKWASCRSTYTAADVGFTHTKTTTTYNGFGNLLSQTTDTVGFVKVERRFAPLYARLHSARGMGVEELYESVSSAVRLAVDMITDPRAFLDQVSFMLELVTDVEADIRWMIARDGCNGPVLRQFSENLYRAAVGLPPVQRAGVRIAGASQATDPPFTPDSPTTVAEACMASNVEQPYLDDSRTFCRCVDQTVAPLLAAADRKLLVQDFRTKFTELVPDQPSRAVVATAAYQAVNSCKEKRR